MGQKRCQHKSSVMGAICMARLDRTRQDREDRKGYDDEKKCKKIVRGAK